MKSEICKEMGFGAPRKLYLLKKHFLICFFFYFSTFSKKKIKSKNKFLRVLKF